MIGSLLAAAATVSAAPSPQFVEVRLVPVYGTDEVIPVDAESKDINVRFPSYSACSNRAPKSIFNTFVVAKFWVFQELLRA